MKKLLFLFSLWPFFLWGQITFDFENGSLEKWEQYPAERWAIISENSLNGSSLVKHVFDNPEAGCDKIFLPHEQILADSAIVWNFKISYNYKPSGSNNWSVFLLSDGMGSKMEPDSSLNALIIGVNYLGTDDFLSIYTQNDTDIERIISSGCDWETIDPGSIVEFRIHLIERFLSVILVKESTIDTIISEYLPVYQTLPESEFFGFRYEYTSSKDRLFQFDDVRIDAYFFKDTIAPKIIGSEIISENKIILEFDENIIAGSNFQVKLNSKKLDSFYIRENKLYCFTSEPMINYRSYKLEIVDLEDRKANADHFLYEFIFFLPDRYDLKINEIMADPSPRVYLPEDEYIEVFNRSLMPVSMKNWTLQTGEKLWKLPNRDRKSVV